MRTPECVRGKQHKSGLCKNKNNNNTIIIRMDQCTLRSSASVINLCVSRTDKEPYLLLCPLQVQAIGVKGLK